MIHAIEQKLRISIKYAYLKLDEKNENLKELHRRNDFMDEDPHTLSD